MTYSKVFGFALILSLLAASAKILFIDYFNPQSWFVRGGFWFFLFLITVTLLRRLGVINYLEVVLISIIWFIAVLLFDGLITSQRLGIGVFTNLHIWIGNLVILLSIILFHQKRHVKIRHEHAKHGKH